MYVIDIAFFAVASRSEHKVAAMRAMAIASSLSLAVRHSTDPVDNHTKPGTYKYTVRVANNTANAEIDPWIANN